MAVASGGGEVAAHRGTPPKNFKVRQQAVTRGGRRNAPSPHNKALLPPLRQPLKFLKNLN